MVMENLSVDLKEIKTNNNIEQLNEIFSEAEKENSLADRLVSEIIKSSKLMYFVLINRIKNTDVLKRIRKSFNNTMLYKNLKKHLTHPDPNVKKYLLNDIGRAKTSVFYDVFLTQIKNEENWEVRKEMVYVLAGYQDDMMISLLVSMLDDSDRRVSSEAVTILADKGDMVLPFLDKYMKLPSTRVKLNILDLLNRIKTVKTLKYLAMLISDPSEEVKIKSQRSIIFLLEKLDTSLLEKESKSILTFLDKQIGKTSLKQIMYILKILLKFRLEGAKIIIKDIENKWGNKTEYFYVLKDIESVEKIYLIIEMLKSSIVELRKKGVDFLRKLEINNENQSEVLRTIGEYIFENIAFLSETEKTTIQEFIIKNKVTQKLIEKLQSRYADERKIAVCIIGVLENEDLYPIILKFVNDPDKAVRTSVVRVLSLEDRDEFIPYYEQMLDDPDGDVQVEAIKAILNNNSEYSKELIIKATTHSNPKVRELCMDKVGSETLKKYIDNFDDLKEEEKNNIVDIFEKHLEESIIIFDKEIDSVELESRKRIVNILSYMKDLKKFKNVLLHALEDPNKEIRSKIVGMVINLKDKDILVSALKLLNDPDKRVRANVIEAFGSYKAKAVIKILKPFLNDPDNRIRANAIVALYKIGYKEAIDKLDEMLEDDSEYMRASAIYAIGDAKSKIKAKLLLNHIDDPSVMVRRNVVRTLSKLGAKDKLKKFFQDENAEIRNLARELSRKR